MNGPGSLYTIVRRADGKILNPATGRFRKPTKKNWALCARYLPTRAEIAVEEPAVAPAEPKAEPTPDKEADANPRPTGTGGAKPPEDGLCRNCRQRRKLNRFKLCYPCWVESEISDREKREGRAWKPGDKHPDWCHCEGLGEHKNGDGTARGFN